MKLEFPKGFYWGAATSSHQVEGDNHNDWTEWEKENAPRLASLARGKQWPDYILNKYPNPLHEENYISGKACDHYNRFRKDFDIAKSLGHNAHRFSIEWSRVEPEEGKFDEKEIEHYRQVILALKERGIEPFVTLWHWTIPVWLVQKGGVSNKNFPKYFERYVYRLMRSLESIHYWITLNEPMVFIFYGYILGIRPPQYKSIRKAITVFRHLISAHKKAFEVIHKMGESDNVVGIAKHDKFFIAGDNKLHNRIFTAAAKYLWNDCFLRRIRNKQDFVGLNYYNSDVIKFDWKDSRKGFYNLEASAEGFYHVIKNLGQYKKPIYILENGLDDPEDKDRSKFIYEHLDAMARTIKEGVDVRGYFHWALLDNFEWASGFWPRFGLVEIDYKTMERKIRDSALEYKKICTENALDANFYKCI